MAKEMVSSGPHRAPSGNVAAHNTYWRAALTAIFLSCPSSPITDPLAVWRVERGREASASSALCGSRNQPGGSLYGRVQARHCCCRRTGCRPPRGRSHPLVSLQLRVFRAS